MIYIVNRERDPGQLGSPKVIAIDSKTKEIYVVAQNALKHSSISVFSDIGNFIVKTSLEYISCPCGIAICERNIYITDFANHYIFHFKKETRSIHLSTKHGGYGESTGKFHRPKQLTISSNGDVYIADYRNNRVQILNSYLYFGQPIWHHSMRYPEDDKLTAEEVYVLCSADPFVHVFSLSGEKIRSLAIPIHSTFFCLDSLGNIFIANRNTDQIIIFTKNGTLVSTVKLGGEVRFIKDAEGIALIDDSKLVIASRRTRSLCIFS